VHFVRLASKYRDSDANATREEMQIVPDIGGKRGNQVSLDRLDPRESILTFYLPVVDASTWHALETNAAS